MKCLIPLNKKFSVKLIKILNNQKTLLKFLKDGSCFALSFVLLLTFSQQLGVRNLLITFKLIWIVIKDW